MIKQNDPEPSNNGRQADGKFAPGNKLSNGRKAGSRNRASLLAQEMIDCDGELVVKKALELAKGGDGAALRLIMERLIPPRKDKAIEFQLPQINNSQDASVAVAQIIEGVSTGELTPQEGDSLAKLIESAARLTELALLEQRVQALEQTIK